MQKYFHIPMLFLALLSVPAAMAANPVMPELGKWWKDSAIADQLRLTDSQVAQIEQSFLDHRVELAKLNAELKRCEADLSKLMQTDPLDEAAVRMQSEMTAKVRFALAKENSDMMVSMRKVLTGEQWERLESIRSADIPYYVPGNGIVNPVLLSKSNPMYTDAAKEAKIGGNVVLSAVVRKDGTIDSVRILKGLGYGLDESAVNTVEKYWKFKPGTLNGRPVDVQVTFEISFRLY